MLGRNFSGRGKRGGMGLGFRGSSPSWPYVGLGRGGLPRCGYYLRGAVVPACQPFTEAQAAAFEPASAPMNKEEELSYLKNQAQSIKEQLDNIDSRMRALDAKENT